LLLATAALLPPSQDAAAQTLADYEFIHWQPRIADPTLRALRLDDSTVSALGGDDAHVVEPATRIDLTFRANGDVVQSFRYSVQFVDSTGIEQRGNASIYVDSFSEELFVHQAAVFTADGEALGIERDTLQVLVEDSGGVFSDVVELVIPWPNLAPASLAVIDYELVTKRARLPAPWSRIFHPRTLSPRGSYELRVRWEPGVARPRVETDFDELSCADVGQREVRCTARDIEAAKTDYDVNYVDEIPYVVVAENVTWSELARTIGNYVAEAQTDTAAVRRVVDEITAGADGDEQKLKAIHSFVSQEIRYVGIETGVNGIVPRDTGRTLERRFGDCKDKTALFVQMADLAGISAVPVLVSSHRKNPDKLQVPSVSYFDHMVSCGIAGNTRFCVDLTDSATSADAYPVYLNGAVSLPLIPDIDRPIALQTSPYAWALHVTSDNRFEGNSLVEHERREYGHGYSGWLRPSLDAMSQSDLQRWAIDDYQSASGSDAEPTFTFAGLRRQHEPLIVESDVTFPNVFAADGPVNYIHIPGWLKQLVSEFETKNEHYAYRFQGVLYRDTTKFSVGRRPVRALGAELDLRSDFGHMRRSYRHAGGTITVETIVEIPSRKLGLDELEPFNAFLKVVQDHATVRFRFDATTADGP
jgi:hypothetical protein